MSQELRRRVRRRIDESNRNEATNRQNNGVMQKYAHSGPGIGWLTASIHIAALLIVITGFILRISFHSGVECDMTYSMRHFLLLRTNVPPHPVYRLFKFTDLRDPRQRHLHQNVNAKDEWSATNKTHWCTAPTTNQTTIVLYVPGHWGSFSQARSLGAHGLQWTRQHHDANRIRNEVALLQNGEWNGRSSTLNKFVYDVYAIDFAEQGGALHANFLCAQSDYVAQVVMSLVVCI